MSTRRRKKSLWGVERGRCVRLTTLPPSVSWLSRQCGILNISQLSLLNTIEKLLGRKSSGSGLENRVYGHGDPLRLPRNTLYPQKLALTSLTSGGHSASFSRGLRPRSLVIYACACVFVCVCVCVDIYIYIYKFFLAPPHVVSHYHSSFSLSLSLSLSAVPERLSGLVAFQTLHVYDDNASVQEISKGHTASWKCICSWHRKRWSPTRGSKLEAVWFTTMQHAAVVTWATSVRAKPRLT
jgi:hypothetical protein